MIFELGEFKIEVELSSGIMGRHMSVTLNTPWWDGGMEGGYNKAKHMKVCVSCGKVAKACECRPAHAVHMTPLDLTDTLNEMNHDMYHYMTGTVHGDETDDLDFGED